MKKILLSLGVIAIVAVGAIGATRAYFVDTETSTGNTFTAGTLDLNLDGGNINVVKFTVANTVPGASGTGYWTLQNVGSVAGFLDIESKLVTNNDNSCNEPEGLSDVTCGAGQPGELGANMNISLFTDANQNGVVDGADVVLYTGTLNSFVPATVADISFPAGSLQYISMNWSIPTTAGNDIQSDSAQLDMTFELGQVAAQ